VKLWIFISLSINVSALNADDTKSTYVNPNFGPFGYMQCTECSQSQVSEGFYPTNPVLPKLKNEEESKGALATTTKLLTNLVKVIPDKNLRNGLTEYLNVIQPQAYDSDSSAGGSNEGIVSYFNSKFSKNQCFQKSAIEFYKEVAATLNKNNACEMDTENREKQSVSYNDYGCSNKRPTLRDQVGQGSKSHLDEGWLMRLALKHGKGSPEAAFELIGMCGHDDTAQGQFIYFDTSDAGQAQNQAILSELKQQKKMIKDELKNLYKNPNYDKKIAATLTDQASIVSNEIKALTKLAGSREQNSCPPGESDFYLPGSLSSKADISSELKQKIIKIQDNGSQNSILPAKHYHVYGSALLGCKMAQQGMNPETAVVVQKQAARFYRGLRMCNASRGLLENQSEFKKSLQVKNFDNSREVETKILQIWEQKLKGELNCGGMSRTKFLKILTIGTKKPNDANFQKCSVLIDTGIVDLSIDEKEFAIKKINTAISRFDVAKLYDDWYVGGNSIAGVKVPCTDHRNKGPKDLMDSNQGLMGKIFKPSGWSQERYELASKRLATWDVDFEWTIAQHAAGSQFGAKACSESRNKKNPFNEVSCLNRDPLNILAPQSAPHQR